MKNINHEIVTGIFNNQNLHEVKDMLIILEPHEKSFLLVNTMLAYGMDMFGEVKPIRDALDTMGFFTAPASTKYHGNFNGGLFVHSFLMFLTLKKWTKTGLIDWLKPTSPLFIGIFHDLCKCDAYKATYSDILQSKDEEGTEVFKIEQTGWEYNPDQRPLGGHATASLVYAQLIAKLNMEEILAIRWHMGSYEKEEWDNYDKAIKMNENVLWTHNADMYVSKVLGV